MLNGSRTALHRFLHLAFLCLPIFNSNLIANGWDPGLDLDKNITFVSLGSHCEIAVHLNGNHLRKAAFPFDWLLTCNHDCFLSLLENDFSCFLDEKHLVQHPIHPYVIENCQYEIEFRHDWPFPDLWCNATRYSQQLQEMYSKYDRRINRFRQLRNYRGKVFFIRVAYDLQNDPNLYWGIDDIEQITAEKAQKLKETLDRYFPCLNFTLVIVNYLENNVPPISGIANVLEFKISKHHKHNDYTRAFYILLNEQNVDDNH
jgi:hypothetical protein